jgi:ABC-2 type transport system ATP-binding protein
MSRTALVFDRTTEDQSGLKVKERIGLAARFRPEWDEDYARELLDRFEIPVKKTLGSLSRGARAAVQVIAGLASRAPLTMYDEAYLGMDAANRRLFINEILADFMRFPRTILFSTHYIGEMENLFSEVLIMDRGRLIAHEDCDRLREKGAAVSGEAAVVDRFIRGREVLSERTLGRQKEAVLFGVMGEADKEEIRRLELTLSRPPLEELFIHLTENGGTKNEG